MLNKMISDGPVLKSSKPLIESFLSSSLSVAELGLIPSALEVRYLCSHLSLAFVPDPI